MREAEGLAVRMTPRRWFWSACAALVIYGLAAGRYWSPAEEGFAPGWLQGMQYRVQQLYDVPLTPFTRLGVWVQTRINRLFAPQAASEQSLAQQVQALREENRLLQHQQFLLDNAIDRLKSLVRNEQMLRDFLDPRTQKILSAAIVTRTSGPGTETCTIDRGSDDGVVAGALVVLEAVPVGRVVSVTPRTALVKLVTDPDRRMRITAKILRRVGDNFEPVVDQCQVQGVGNGLLISESVDASRALAPEPGDLVRVDDPDWRPMGGALLGTVQTVRRSEKQQLRYTLTIRPAVQVSESTQLLVLLPMGR